MPALPAVLGGRRQLREATCLPPQRKRNRVEGDLGVAPLRGDAGVEPEECGAEIDETLNDVVVTCRDAEAKAFRVEGAVAHEIANELREIRSHAARDASPEVCSPVEVTERR